MSHSRYHQNPKAVLLCLRSPTLLLTAIFYLILTDGINVRGLHMILLQQLKQDSVQITFRIIECDNSWDLCSTLTADFTDTRWRQDYYKQCKSLTTQNDVTAKEPYHLMNVMTQFNIIHFSGIEYSQNEASYISYKSHKHTSKSGVCTCTSMTRWVKGIEVSSSSAYSQIARG